MKIYLDLPISVIKIIEKKLGNYIKTTKKFYEIYTQEGMFRIENDTNQLFKLKIGDIDNHEIVKLGNWDCIIDKSIIEYVNEIYQIPILNGIVNMIEETYKISNKSLLTFVILRYQSDHARDFYFTLDDKEDINNKFIQEEILSFLSLIN